ncbi:MAG: phosphodiester glycosidase family protein [Clostridia bacterium]|nr:phosphodiester glycosidase family protein [Clostridia bacterium]
MKKYKSKKSNEATKGVAFKAAAAVSAVLIVAVGVLCTSPSKAEDAPYYAAPQTTEPDVEVTVTTAEPETVAPETLSPIDTSEDPVTAGVDTESPDETTVGQTAAETTAEPVTTPETTTVTTPVTTATTTPSEGIGKQIYREYNGRQFGENETFVGEYKTDRVSVGVSNVREGDVSYYICDIVITSPSDFLTAFPNGKISQVAYTSKIAASVGAGFAVNGDFCGHRTYGIIIRNGGLYRNKKSDNWDLCYMNAYGDLITCKNDKQDGKALVDDGVLQSWCFGPTLVTDYKALTKDQFNTPDLSRSAHEPRTAIGQVEELHYIIIVVDAIRSGASTVGGGMTFTELAKTFEALGCKTAYNLDGGGSTALYLNGKIINDLCMGGERAVSDIIYLK